MSRYEKQLFVIGLRVLCRVIMSLIQKNYVSGNFNVIRFIKLADTSKVVLFRNILMKFLFRETAQFPSI